MMEPFERIDIQELPLCVPSVRRQVEDFLGRNGLRLEEVDLYQAALSPEGEILAGGGLARDVVKCIAVSPAARSLGLTNPLISSLISVAASRGYTNVKVFTKPENRAVFESLGFRLLAEAPRAILMENGRGLEDYCRYLRAHQAPGVIVMNANPFTLGHKYLIEQADFSTRPTGLGRNDKDPATGLGRNDRSIVISSDARRAESRNLVVIPVREDASLFPYEERLAMIRSGCDGLADVVEGSDYQISAATFPTYFLKDLSDAAETQMRLDIDLFGRHIAPALGASVRFVGSEPVDPLTARYNALMKELLPSYGVEVVEIPRRQTSAVIPSDVSVILSEVEESSSQPITATTVRSLLDEGRFKAASALTPASTWPYLLADLAGRALRLELNTPMKPGLVGSDSCGAHADMDYAIMRRGIDAIRPFFPRMAMAASAEQLRQLGIDAEAAMLAATGGVNTHRGAIFALGLALNVAGREMEAIDNKLVMQNRLGEIARAILRISLKDSELHFTVPSHGARSVEAYGAKGAMQMALDGYKELYDSWLPYYRSVKADEYGRQRTLLKIMSTLDDTCVIHRVGYDRALQVKAEAKELQEDFSVAALQSLCARYAAERISPGGAADMLALTVFMDSILQLH